MTSKEYKEKIGHCERCGETEGLQVHHIKTRKVKYLKDKEYNMLCLCYSCHIIFFHRSPLQARKWLEKHKPEKLKKINEVLRKGVLK